MIGFHVADALRRSNTKGCMSDGTYAPDYSLSAVDLKSFKNNLVDIIQQNKERWKELAAQGELDLHKNSEDLEEKHADTHP